MGRLAKQFKTRVSLAAAGKLDKANASLWEEAYVDMAPLTVKALPQLGGLGVSQDQTEVSGEQLANLLPLLKQAFLWGKVVVDGELVDATADDLEDLPLEITNAIISVAMGQPDPKS